MARELVVEFVVAGSLASRVTRFDLAADGGHASVLEIDVVLDEYQALGALLGTGAKLAFGFEGEEPRRFSGIVESASIAASTARGRDERGVHYTLTVVSPLVLLGRVVTSRIFQEMTVKDIVTEVLRGHGITRMEWRLGASCPEREYCVQYQESSLAFVSRLCEQEGIFFFGEEGDDGEVLIFADDSRTAAKIEGNAALPVHKRTSLDDTADAVYAVRERREVRSGRFSLRDYNFERPELDMTVSADAAERRDLEVYDYPGGYTETGDGKRWARVRLEAEQVGRHVLDIDAVCPRIGVGRALELLLADDLDGDYFVFAARHAYRRQDGGSSKYAAHARLVPKDVPYRSPLRTPRPVVEGPQTATVTAPPGSASETIHTDKHGRCKVRFRWDRSNTEDDRASCWMRVAQMQTSGSMMLARIGWEVIVEFLEGDPDRPIVTGLLYNSAMTPPYALPEGRTRTVVRTVSTPGGGGANEVRFEDRAGSEEILIRAHYDMKVAVANDAKRNVGNNESLVVASHASLSVAADQKTQITKGYERTIGGDQSVTVGGNRDVEVNAVAALESGGAARTIVGGNQFEMDGNPLEALLALAAEKAQELAMAVADRALDSVQAHVDGAINQVMGPIQSMNAALGQLQAGMQALERGDLSGAPRVLSAAANLPGPGDFARSLGGGGDPSTAERGPRRGAEATRQSGGSAGPERSAQQANPAPSNPLVDIARHAAHSAIESGVDSAHNALAAALGVSGSGGGGQSGANTGGPAGDVAGVDAEDRAKGPGHSTAKIGGSYSETIGGLELLAALQSVDRNIGGSANVNVGAATVHFSVGDHAESVGGSKTEQSLGLVVLSKAGESEKVGGSKTTMVGGAILEKIGKAHAIKAGGPATFIGAFHKVEAQESIELKCGASSIVIDSSGITITSPLVAFLAPKIQLSGKVSEI